MQMLLKAPVVAETMVVEAQNEFPPSDCMLPRPA